jgi:hypothetical protein
MGHKHDERPTNWLPILFIGLCFMCIAMFFMVILLRPDLLSAFLGKAQAAVDDTPMVTEVPADPYQPSSTPAPGNSAKPTRTPRPPQATFTPPSGPGADLMQTMEAMSATLAAFTPTPTLADNVDPTPGPSSTPMKIPDYQRGKPWAWNSAVNSVSSSVMTAGFYAGRLETCFKGDANGGGVNWQFAGVKQISVDLPQSDLGTVIDGCGAIVSGFDFNQFLQPYDPANGVNTGYTLKELGVKNCDQNNENCEIIPEGWIKGNEDVVNGVTIVRFKEKMELTLHGLQPCIIADHFNKNTDFAVTNRPGLVALLAGELTGHSYFVADPWQISWKEAWDNLNSYQNLAAVGNAACQSTQPGNPLGSKITTMATEWGTWGEVSYNSVGCVVPTDLHFCDGSGSVRSAP